MEKNLDAYSRIFLGLCILLGSGVLFLKPMPNRFVFDKVIERKDNTGIAEGTETVYTMTDTITGKIYNYSKTIGMFDYNPFVKDKIIVINPLLGSEEERKGSRVGLPESILLEIEKKMEEDIPK